MLEKPKAGFDGDARLQAEPNYKEPPVAPSQKSGRAFARGRDVGCRLFNRMTAEDRVNVFGVEQIERPAEFTAHLERPLFGDDFARFLFAERADHLRDVFSRATAGEGGRELIEHVGIEFPEKTPAQFHRFDFEKFRGCDGLCEGLHFTETFFHGIFGRAFGRFASVCGQALRPTATYAWAVARTSS